MYKVTWHAVNDPKTQHNAIVCASSIQGATEVIDKSFRDIGTAKEDLPVFTSVINIGEYFALPSPCKCFLIL